jgi:hypothetical protein
MAFRVKPGPDGGSAVGKLVVCLPRAQLTR